eukprot:GHVP01024922.1.p1 GENE.GHVP01024922.1~~GHVP01024922.1.p1  ORF type:complete len:982 (-),score=166.73 GHVP01024922.1:1710-4655(-)
MQVEINKVVKALNDSCEIRSETRQSAEKFLVDFSQTPNFLETFWQILKDPSSGDGVVAMTAVVFLKNTLFQMWEQEKLSAKDRTLFKTQCFDLLVSLRQPIRKQFEILIEKIAILDFPEEWEDFLKDIKQRKLTSHSDISIRISILSVLDGIFKTYRDETKSNDLMKKIVFVVNEFKEEHMEVMLKASVQSFDPLIRDKALPLSVLNYCIEILHSLMFHDIPEYYEDNVSTIMELFTNILIQPCDPDKMTMENLESLIHAKVSTCIIISLFCVKEAEILDPFAKVIFEKITTLLAELPPEDCFDALAEAAMRVLSAGSNVLFSTPFSEDMINTITTRVILPNLRAREFDLESMSDPPEFVHNMLGVGDLSSRKEASKQLILSLKERYSNMTVHKLLGAAQEMIRSSANRQDKEAALQKEAALALLGSLASKTTNRFGVVIAVSQDIPLPELVNLFSEELVKQPTEEPASVLLKLTALKFTSDFRLHVLTEQNVEQILRVLLGLLFQQTQNGNSLVYIVSSFSANVIDKILGMKKNKYPFIASPNVQNLIINECLAKGFIDHVLVNSFRYKNHLQMRLMFKILLLCSHSLPPTFINQLQKILIQILKSFLIPDSNDTVFPWTHQYCIYTFECLTQIAKCIGTNPNLQAERRSFEETLIPTLGEILRTDKAEMAPLALQLFACLLDTANASTNMTVYEELFGYLLTSDLWSKQSSHVPGVVRVLESLYRQPYFVPKVQEKSTEILTCWEYTLNHKKLKIPTSFKMITDFVVLLPSYIYKAHYVSILKLIISSIPQKSTFGISSSIMMFFAAVDKKDFGENPSAKTSVTLDAIESLKPGVGFIENILDLLFFPKVSFYDGAMRWEILRLFSYWLSTPTFMTNDSLRSKTLEAFHTMALGLSGRWDDAEKEETKEDDDLSTEGYEPTFAILKSSSTYNRPSRISPEEKKQILEKFQTALQNLAIAVPGNEICKALLTKLASASSY